MLTKIEITTLDSSRSPIPNCNFVIHPYRYNSYNNGMRELHGATDSAGKAIVSLEPAWFPYHLKYTTFSGEIVKSFFVFEFDGVLRLQDIEISYLDIDYFTPSGQALMQMLKAKAETQAYLHQIKNEKDKLLNAIKTTQQSSFDSKMAVLVTNLELLKSLVKALAEDKTLILEEQKKLQAKTKELMEAHTDMIQIAKDYVIAKNMGILNLGGHYIWFDSNDVFRWNTKLPTTETDGTPIN